MGTKTNHSVASILGINGDNSDISGPPRHRQRRNRTLFNDCALDTLEQSFQVNQYPDINQREQLAERVSVTEARIQVWFQNRRSRLRRNNGTPMPRTEKPVKSPSPPSKLSIKPEPLAMLPSQPHRLSYPMSYPSYMFGYSVMYPSGIHPATHSHYPDLSGYISSPTNSPLWSPTSPNFHKFFDSPISPRFNTFSTPVKTMFPFPDMSPAHRGMSPAHSMSPAHHSVRHVTYNSSIVPTMSMKIPVRMAPLDLSDWSSSETRLADVKNNSGSSLGATSINVSTSSDDEDSK